MDKLLVHILGFKPLNRFIDKLLGHYVTIFMIHRSVAKDDSYQGLSPALLEQCLIYAQKNNYHFASLDEVVHNALNDIKPDRPTLCFTLDDGFDDQVQELVPVLLKYGVKPTIFVLSNFVDGVDWPWDSRLAYIVWNTQHTSGSFSYNGKNFELNFQTPQQKLKTRRALVKYAKHLSSKELDQFIDAASKELGVVTPSIATDIYKPVSWDTLRRYESLGLTIGSHACSHRVFSSLTMDEVESEVSHANARLKAELKSPSQVFCYPSGTAQDYSTKHAELIKEMGYIAAVSANPGNTTNKLIRQDLFNIQRHGFPLSFARFVRYSSWLEAIRSRLS